MDVSENCNKSGLGNKADKTQYQAVVKSKKNSKPTFADTNSLATLFNQGKMAESEQLAKDITRHFPNDGFGWKVLGAIYQQKGLVDEALHALKTAVKLLPGDSEAQYNLGNCYYDQQQLDEAIKCYKKSVTLAPTFAKAHYNLGNVYKNQDNLEQAELSYRKALKIDANNVQIACNLAQTLYERANFSEALIYFEQALKIQPDFSAARVGLGAAFSANGQLKEAEESFRQALKVNPNDVDAHLNLGDHLKNSGKLSEAESCYRTALTITPESAETYVKLATLLKSMGKVAESISCYTQALSIDPLREKVHNDLGLILAEQSRLNAAEVCYQKALEIAPDYWVTHNNLGLTLYAMGRFIEAESAFNKALELNPGQALVFSNLSLPLVAQGQIRSAEISLLKAIEIDPKYVNAYINLCTNYLAQGRAKEAESACLKALELQPDSTMAKSNLLFTMNYSGGHSVDYRLEQACQYGSIVAGKVSEIFKSYQLTKKVKRLRIGLVSGDLRQHPVAYFLENWAQHIDSSTVEIIAYLTDSREDAVTARLKPHFSGWKSLVGLSDQAAAQLIHDDGLNILIDLSGHTAGNRLSIFAWKPAPVQVSWLGYFATTGMTTMDYFIADEVGVPEQNKGQFVEKVKYLPDTRLCFTVPEVSIEVSPLPALGCGHITFGSFQTMVKAGEDVLALWAKVMIAVPNSRLRWQCKSFGDSAVADDIRQRLAHYGIHSDRLILLGSVSREAYLTTHAEVDVILDTFPYPGGTTTCEALWMGVPTLTLAGNTLIARQGASMLTAAGLADWVAANEADYVNKALSFASDLEKLANLRANLRQQVLASPLFDAPRFAKNIETALWEMWNDSQLKHEHYQSGSQILTDSFAEDNAGTSLKLSVEVVSATRFSESDFWSKSALGLSLKRHLKQDARLTAKIAFENSRGLSEIFNESIDQADDDAVLIFIHDDVWVDEANLADAVIEGLGNFDVIGVAGNIRRVPNQPSWVFLDHHEFTWDDMSNLSGHIAHGKSAFGEVKNLGAVPAECELLDGVFLAVKKNSLQQGQVRFDAQFDFHFYDMDFCRSARKAGLRMGTWSISLTHQSGGDFGTPQWRACYLRYLNKWEDPSSYSGVVSNLSVATQVDQDLQKAVNEVLQMAVEHQNAGRIDQAEQLYLEILNIQPKHADANHHLGVIEAHLKGAPIALPRLELAVQEKPENEQFWVSYIDALMQSGAIDTVADALELGQKFGLRAETAQILAAELLREFDVSAEGQQALALEALKVELKPSSKHHARQVDSLKKTTPVFYIWAPEYVEYSSGIKALHLLCDRLNGLGYEAYVTASVNNKNLKTPQITPELIQAHKLESRLQIAIYPEVQMGNPLLVPNVIRYLLNKPNFFLKTSWFGYFHQDEQVLHYDDVFAVPWVKSKKVCIQVVDRNLFKLPAKPGTDRSGFLVYSHRVSPDLDLIPSWCQPFEVISMANPRSPTELAGLYKKSAGMIVFERTSAATEAMLCGCPVIFCSSYGLDKASIYYAGFDEYGIVWDFDQAAFGLAQKTIESFGDIYDARNISDIQALKLATDNMIDFFQMNESEGVETTPAFNLGIANKYRLQADIKNAILRYRQLIVDHPMNVEAYFRMGDALSSIGLFQAGLETLMRGEAYLAALPKHQILSAIRVMYYQKLAEVCHAIGDFSLEHQYVERVTEFQVLDA